MPIISIRDLVVEYDGRRILNGVNLDIEHGETMVLLGGSGSGKSTLLRQIIGLECPKSGSVHVKGMDITRCSQSDLKKVHLSTGVAFQSAALFNSAWLFKARLCSTRSQSKITSLCHCVNTHGLRPQSSTLWCG